MSRVNNFIRLGSISLLLFGIALPVCGQEYPAETVALEVAPVPELIDV